MELRSITDWIAWGGIVLPLIITAISAFLYVRIEMQKQKNTRYDQFYKLMDQIGMQEGSIASKMAAISELKKFPEYKSVIIRLCLDGSVEGTMAWLLEREFSLTAKHFGHSKKTKGK